MTKRARAVGLGLGLAVAAPGLLCAPAGGEAEVPGPVVVELFTSQGCSSCPSADAVFSTWGAEGFARGEVLPLSFDVDYWDYLGWKDLFSAPAYSERQRLYDVALRVRTYTPQMVVAGRAAFVGSDRSEAESQVGRFLGEPRRARLSVARARSSRLGLAVAAERLGKAEGDLHVMLALFESGLVTDVRAGENQGRALKNDFVVRRLVDLGGLPRDGKPLRRQVDAQWEPGWNAGRAGAAVFLQDADTRAIYDAASLYPLARQAVE